MKTAVSLPDDLFHAAEREARRARKSRGQLYAEALADDRSFLVERAGRLAPKQLARILHGIDVVPGR